MSIADVFNRYGLPRIWEMNNLPRELMPQYVPDMPQRLDLDSRTSRTRACRCSRMKNWRPTFVTPRAQLSYDEIRLLRELKNSERRISGNKLDVGLERLVKEGYATTFHPNASETLYSITRCVNGSRLEREGYDFRFRGKTWNCAVFPCI